MTPLRLVSLALALLLQASPAAAANGHLEAWFLDVGQGTATFVSTPGGRTILVDAGPPSASGIIARFLRAHLTGPLDVAIASHVHLDHVGGMAAALRVRGAATYLDPADRHRHADRVLTVLDSTVQRYAAQAGHADATTPPLRLPDGTTITFLSPPQPELTACEDTTNCNSIAVLVRAGDATILLAGDTEAATEVTMLRTFRGLLRADVLGVGHHGSRFATSTAWLRTVKPRLAVISCGLHNRYHHPHPSTLRRLERQDVAVHRTDLEGTVHVVMVDGAPTIAPP